MVKTIVLYSNSDTYGIKKEIDKTAHFTPSFEKQAEEQETVTQMLYFVKSNIDEIIKKSSEISQKYKKGLLVRFEAWVSDCRNSGYNVLIGDRYMIGRITITEK